MVSLTADRFAALVAALADSGQADLFLSSIGAAHGHGCVVGFRPRAELCLQAHTAKGELESFCFAERTPVLGFVSYEYGLALRDVPVTKIPETGFGRLRQYGAYLDYDLRSGELRLYGTDTAAVRELERLVAAPPPREPFRPPQPAEVVQSLSREAYLEGVRETLRNIRAGNTYQLNLSIRFQRPAADVRMSALFVHLWRTRPASYYVFMAGEAQQLVSTSPERFLRVHAGQVLSQPIKGTLAFAEYTTGLTAQLAASPKESAELSMIVDLVRNDISANCEYGSVRVDHHKSFFVVDQLLQMYSDVSGCLRRDRTCLDLLLDASPAGSVTGCPKRRSLEIIDALEPHSRGAYCGSFVLIRDEREMDSSVGIRTCWRNGDDHTLVFHAGSGIVVDSVPQREYEETLSKARKFLTLGAG